MNGLWMTLKAQDLIVYMKRGERAEFALGDHRGVFRERCDLILMADKQRQFLYGRAHPGSGCRRG